jgi:trimeric autotransporter adhesin
MDSKPTTTATAAAAGKQSAAAQAAAAAAAAAHAAAAPAVYWSCAISVSYKTSLPAQAAAFSSDGSLLAVTFAGIVTLWGSAAAARAAAAAAATAAVSVAAVGDAPASIEATGGRSSSGSSSGSSSSSSAAVALLGTLLSDSGVTRPGDVVAGDRAAQHSLAFLPKSSSLLVRDRGSAALWDVISAVQQGAGPKWSYRGAISCAAAVDVSSGSGGSSSSGGLRVGRRTGNVALCIDRSAKGQGGGCTVVLLSADSSVPLYSWRLAQAAVRSMVFTLPSSSSSSSSSSSGGSGSASRAGLVVLTHSGDVQLLSVTSASSSSATTTATMDGAGVLLRPTALLAGALPLSGKRKLMLLSEDAEAQQQQQQQQQPSWRTAGASPLLLDTSSTGEFTSLLSDTATVHLPPATELLGSYLRSHLRAAPTGTATAAAGAAAGASSATLPLRNGALNGVLAKGSAVRNGGVRGGISNGRALGIDPTLLALFSKHMAAASESN